MIRLVLAAALMLVLACVAQAERRVALVFGVNSYKTLRPLTNAVHDAQTIDATLEELGFEVALETNRDLRRMRRALDDFRIDAAGADVALVFYAGHGVEIDGENRLLPVDADASGLAALKASTLPLEEVRDTVTGVGKVGLIVLDACRNDPFGSGASGGRSAVALRKEVAEQVKPGLGRVGRAENVLFAFSAAPGQTAADGTGEDSPFTTALAKYFGTEGLEVRSVLTLVQQEVYDASRGRQLPYVESGLPKMFFASATASVIPERERLLLAMADLTPTIRGEVEQTAAAKDVPLAPLYGALLSADLVSLGDGDRARKLGEAAQAYRETQEKLRTLSSADPIVTRLRAEAQQSLALGAFVEARAKLKEAAALDEASGDALATNLVERRVSEAQTYVAEAGVARTQLDYAGAVAAFERAAALHSRIENEDVPDAARRDRDWLLADLGLLQMTTGNTAAALDAYSRMRKATELRLAKAPAEIDAKRDVAVSRERIGDVRTAQGDLAGALVEYLVDLVLTEELAQRDPDDAPSQHDLAISQSKIGNIKSAQGDLSGAYDAYWPSFLALDQLARADPGNVSLVHDLALSESKMGDVMVARGDMDQALAFYQDGLAWMEILVAADPNRTDWQADIATSRERIGDVIKSQGDLSGALAAYQASLDIRTKLAQRDPANAGWQRDLSVSQNEIGHVKIAQGDLAGALDAFQASLAVRTRLAASDPSNAGWQHDVAVSHGNLGDVKVKQGDSEGALSAYQASLAIFTQLTTTSPANAGWQGDRSSMQIRIGDLLAAKGDIIGAMASYQNVVTIVSRLAENDPGNVGWQRNLLASHDRIGDMKLARDDATGALAAYEVALEVAKKLAHNDARNMDWQRSLAIGLSKVGNAKKAQGNTRGALADYQASFEITNRMAASDPTNASWQRDLIASHFDIAELGEKPRTHFRAALDVVMAMQDRGVLGPSDDYIPDLLHQKLAGLPPGGD